MSEITKVTPTTQTIYWDRTGSVPPVTQLRVNITEAEVVDYVTFVIERISGTVDWLFSSNTSGELPIDGGNIPLELGNLNSLYAGNYQSKVIVTVSNDTGFEKILTATVNFNITGDPPTLITTDKPNYNVTYRRSDNTFSGETVVNILNNTALDAISLDTIGTLLKEVSFTDTFNLEEDPAFPFATNTELPLQGTKVVNCRLKKNGVFIYSFTVTITVVQTDEIIAFPDSFEFLLRKGFSETKSETLTLTNPMNHAFTLAKPAWLTLSEDAGAASASITVETANSDTLNVGEVSDFIVISYDSKTISIPVKLTVIAFVDINLSEHNFCLDDVFLKVYKMNEPARFVRITLTMTFKTPEGESVVTSPYQIPYFQDKINTDIGKKIQNYFPVFMGHLFNTNPAVFDNQFIYKAAAVSFLVEELDINYGVLLSKTLPAADFFAGNRPAQFPLFTNYPVRRKYDGSTFFFSYLTDLLAPADFTGVATTGNAAGAKEVHAVKLLDGGILNDAALKNSTGVELLPWPAEEKKVVVQWLNNNLVPEWMMLSGKYALSDEFEQIYDDFQINGQKYDTQEKQKLTVTTGFILKEELKLLKALNKSAVTYILLEGEIYKALCITSKLVERQSEETLPERELEFIIVK